MLTGNVILFLFLFLECLTAGGDTPLQPPIDLWILSAQDSGGGTAPSITAQPQNQTVDAGQSATFRVTAAGDVPLSYHWTFNGENVGSSSSAYTRADCQLADSGGSVRVTISNASGPAQSSPATLRVNPNGTNYYAATNGSSGNTGVSMTSAWPLQYALNHLGPGITVTVMPGLYAGKYVIDRKLGPATVRSQYKWKAVFASVDGYAFGIYGTNIVVDGLCVTNAAHDGIGLTGVSNTLKNCWIVNSTNVGVNASSPANSNPD